MKSTQIQKAIRLNELHVPGEPLIVVNVWDAITAKIVSEVPGKSGDTILNYAMR